MATVIVGSGLAALTCALNLPKDEHIIILTKGKQNQSNSVLAQGGIAASENLIEDIKEHIDDTCVAGSNTNCADTVNYMISNSFRAIDFLKSSGVNFDHKDDAIHLTREGGHSRRRILHVGGDQSGRLIIESLLNKCRESENIQIIEDARAIAFSNERLVYFQGSEVKYIKTNNYVIAAGGATGNFSVTTANSLNTGDYLNLAKTANLNLKDMHLIQFHPTAFQPKNSKQAFLISEAVRGEGAYLRNSNGIRFMSTVHERGELAPRDIVAREIFNQLQDGQEVFIDARHLPAELISERFIQINAFLNKYKLDLKNDLIPVVPAAHYQLGGISAKYDGETNQENIYAIGECATTGFHGSNRLASNSLLECVIMGQACAQRIKCNSVKDMTSVGVLECVQDDQEIYDTNELITLISNELSIVRNWKQIHTLLERLNYELKVHEKRHRFSNEWYNYYNLILMGLNIANTAIHCDSTGCHYIEEKNA